MAAGGVFRRLRVVVQKEDWPQKTQKTQKKWDGKMGAA
jgi:hypothetical protein